MSLFKNNLEQQNKSQGSIITHQEWNSAINQRRLQTNYQSDIVDLVAQMSMFTWVEVDDSILIPLTNITIINTEINVPINNADDLILYFNQPENGLDPNVNRFEAIKYKEWLIYSQPAQTMDAIIKYLEQYIKEQIGFIDDYDAWMLLNALDVDGNPEEPPIHLPPIKADYVDGGDI